MNTPNEEERKKLPQWARERLEVEEEMGRLETTASPGVVAAGVAYIVFLVGVVVVGCVIVYMVGRLVVG